MTVSADRKTLPITGAETRQVAAHARDVAIAAQNLVERQRLT
jgi:hypothetical protein